MDQKYLGQVIADVAGLTCLALIFLIYYTYTKPYEQKLKKNLNKEV
jgi:hypothetical protein